ncbi:MAG: 3-hydroxyacyl-CoA dehydrogenase [Burkholderiales bacterium]|jgi:3-hydroxybutyryl-CoA dehydrogenase|nr:3-hydroxyacyl-CoA dehydrogenase [Burkholderiales bacterium]
MSLDVARPDLTLGIVGTGVMGRGVAQIAAQAGIRAILYDTREGAAEAAREYVAGQLGKLAEKGKLTPDAANAATARIEVAHVLPHLSPCHVVIEAIVEDLDTKRALFSHLEGLVREDALLASNTSSLQVTAIAAKLARPERVGGFHFFNPVPLMKVVEVIEGVMTAPWVGDALAALARRMGHTPVRAQDTPGFIVNHAGRAYGTEALAILREAVAPFYEIDRILRDVAGFRMGPFELMDLTGLDVSHPVMESIYDQYYQEPRYRPSPITAQRVVAGLLGRKSDGRGFYRYADGQQEAMPVPPVPKSETPPVWVSRFDAGELAAALAEKLGATLDLGASPANGSLVLVAPLGLDATSAAARESLDPTRTVAIDFFVPPHKRRTLMTTPITLPEYRDAAHALFASDGVPVSVIRDSTGFVVQRVLAHIVNIGCDIVQQRICSPADLDRAVTLGLGYPQGPLAWGDTLGPQRVLAVLDAMLAETGDPRYRPSPWLRRRASLGVSLLTPDS